MYVLTELDGRCYDSSKINYAKNVGKIVQADIPEIPSIYGGGIRAARNPNDCFAIAKIPCRAFKIKGIYRISGDRHHAFYQAAKVIEEITDLDNLFGWKYSEVLNPINPFEIHPPKVTKAHIELLEKWVPVRDSVTASVIASIETSVSKYLNTSMIRDLIGAKSIISLIWNMREAVSVWEGLKIRIGSAFPSVKEWKYIKPKPLDHPFRSTPVWNSVWEVTWAYTGSLFPNIKEWKGTNHRPDEYPFQPAVDLWKQGLVPSFDGKIWRLHGGYEKTGKTKVLWEGEIQSSE